VTRLSVFVIIPVYGNWEDTINCLTALESQTTEDFQVLVADDGSPTPPPTGIGQLKRVSYMKNEHAGYGSNCNHAARQAVALGATHLLFLNSDTNFQAGFMEYWIRRAAEMPNAILSPLIYWSRYPSRIWSSGGRFTVFTPFVRSRSCFARVTEVDTVTGCALLVPVDAWTTLGGFDAKYQMYFEDFDLTLRAKGKGIPTYVIPDPELRVMHHVSGSFREAGAWEKHYFMLTSSLIFIRTHYRGVRKSVCFVLSGAHLAITTILSLPEMPKPRLLWSALVRGFSG
jgi:GT2 family glycosyltransferase